MFEIFFIDVNILDEIVFCDYYLRLRVKVYIYFVKKCNFVFCLIWYDVGLFLMLFLEEGRRMNIRGIFFN